MNKKIILSIAVLSMVFSGAVFAAEVIPLEGGTQPGFGCALPLPEGAVSCVLPSEDFTPVSCEEVGLVSTLKLGNRNEQVTILQEILNYAGYDAGNIDGWFGFKTRSAVKSLQASIGVKADGVVGPLTKEAMLEICTSYVSSN